MDYPCEHEGCEHPGRLVIGIEDGAKRHWCIFHTNEGIRYFRAMVNDIRRTVLLARAREIEDEA